MNVLVVDDEDNILDTTEIALQNMGHEAYTARTRKQALKNIRNHRIDAIFLDLRLGRDNGLEVMAEMLKEQPDLAVIVFTAYSSLETAVDSIKRGAYDYIQKPFLPEQIQQTLERLEKQQSLQTRVNTLQQRLKSESPSVNLESNEDTVRRTYEIAFRAASSEAPILLLGPSGTGKTVLAEAIHQNSPRASHNFVTVHCPSLSKELLESELFGHVTGAFTGATRDTWGKVAAADRGTLFLDEIGELSPGIQPKLLRLLQEKKYERIGETATRTANVRVIAATNRDLKEEVEAGRFREDLFYRLNVIAVAMPALKDRPGDIIPMAEEYLRFFKAQTGRSALAFDEEAEQAIRDYAWPGNLRELRNVIERCAILAPGDTITRGDLPDEVGHYREPQQEASSVSDQAEVALESSLEEVESAHIRKVLASSKNLDEAARILGIDKVTLYRKRKRMGLV